MPKPGRDFDAAGCRGPVLKIDMQGSAFVIIVVGLLLMYAVISNKFYCIEGCAKCLAGRLDQKATGYAGGTIGPVSNVTGAGQRLGQDLRGLF